MAKYKKPFSVDHRKPVFIESSDPRYKNLEQYRSRLGRDIAVTTFNEPKTLQKYSAPANPFMNVYGYQNTYGISFVTDSEKNIYLLSNSRYQPEDYNQMLFLTKMDKNGNFIWEIRIDNIIGGGYASFNGTRLTIDSSNNIYIPISLDRSPNNTKTPTDLVGLLKINSNGEVILNKLFTDSNYINTTMGINTGAQCVLDSSLNIYIVANIKIQDNTIAGQYKVLIIKLDPSGNILWQKIHTDTAYFNGTFFGQLLIDSLNNLYILTDLWNGRILKVDTNGNIVLSKGISGLVPPGPGSNISGLVSDITIDNDNFYIAAHKKINTVSGENSYVHLLKLDSSLTLLWEKTIGLVNTDTFFKAQISSIQNDSIFITITEEIHPDIYYYIVKLDADGNVQTQQKMTHPIIQFPSTQAPNFGQAGTAWRINSDKTVQSIPYSPRGAMGTLYTTSSPTDSYMTEFYNCYGLTDDPRWEFTLPFSINYNGTSYNKIYVSGNSYVTFGSGSCVYIPTESDPPLDKILVDARDGSSNKCYFYTNGTEFNIRLYCGSTYNDYASEQIIWELYGSISNPNSLEVTIISNVGDGTSIACTPSLAFAGTVNDPYTTTSLAIFDIDQNSDSLYGIGLLKIDYETACFIFKIPNSLQQEYGISFSNVVMNEPSSTIKSFNINLENVSIFSSTTTSDISVNDFTQYTYITGSYAEYSYSFIIDKNTAEILNETNGVIV